MATERHNHRLLRNARNRERPILRPHPYINDTVTLAPFGDCLDGAPQLSAQRRVRGVRSLYEFSERVYALTTDLHCKSPAG